MLRCDSSDMIISCQERYVPVGRAISLVRNISIGLITVALNVRAAEPASSGAGVKLAAIPPSLLLFCWSVVERGSNADKEARGSSDLVKMGEMIDRRCSYPIM